MKIDVESLRWLETALDDVCYGEVGLVFVLHAGRIVRRKKILEIKEGEDLTNQREHV